MKRFKYIIFVGGQMKDKVCKKIKILQYVYKTINIVEKSREWVKDCLYIDSSLFLKVDCLKQFISVMVKIT